MRDSSGGGSLGYTSDNRPWESAVTLLVPSAMEHGDLAVSIRQHYVVVLEGVLAMVTDITETRRLRRDQVTGHNIHWLDIPMRRLATMRRQFPDVGAEVVTFIDEERGRRCGACSSTRRSVPVDSCHTSRSIDGYRCCPIRTSGLQAVFDSDDRPPRPLRPARSSSHQGRGLRVDGSPTGLLSKIIRDAELVTVVNARITPEFFTDDQWHRVYEYLLRPLAQVRHVS